MDLTPQALRRKPPLNPNLKLGPQQQQQVAAGIAAAGAPKLVGQSEAKPTPNVPPKLRLPPTAAVEAPSTPAGPDPTTGANAGTVPAVTGVVSTSPAQTAVSGAIAKGAGVPPASVSPDDPYAATNQRINDLVTRLLESTGDTAEGEALMREQNQRDFGDALINQRARLGRSMGGGGGAAALEGDLRSNNALDLSQRLLDYRTTEDQRATDNALNAVGAELDMRNWASADELTRKRLELMQKLLGLEGEGGGDGGGGGDIGFPAGGAADVANDLLFNGGVETETPDLAATINADNSVDSPAVVSEIPKGDESFRYGTNAAGQEVWVVRRGGKTTYYTKG